MNPTEYRAAIKTVGFKSQNEAGRFFGVSEVTGRRWAIHGPPSAVAKFLRLMLALRFSPAYVDEMIAR